MNSVLPTGRGCHCTVRPRPVSAIMPVIRLLPPAPHRGTPMFCRSLVVLALLAGASRAADIVPVKGDTIKGDIVRVSDTEVVFKQDGKDVTKSIKEILRIDYRDIGK